MNTDQAWEFPTVLEKKADYEDYFIRSGFMNKNVKLILTTLMLAFLCTERSTRKVVNCLSNIHPRF